MASRGQRVGRVRLGRAWFIEGLNDRRWTGALALIKEDGGVLG